MRRASIILTASIALLYSACENREVNPETGPDFSEIHENMEYHFDRVKIDGQEYFILERDRNNPHEGFGFMALNGTRMNTEQDTIKAYLKTLLEVQTQILAKVNNESSEEASAKVNTILKKNLSDIVRFVPEDSTKQKAEN
ncbi:MAG: hypothetical protein JXQ96_10925 [Cyclobacteriaceae bacterium]